MQQAPIGKMRVYGCGGMGINIAAYFNNAAVEPNCAEVMPAYIDASRSNLRDDFNDEDIFVLENVDGSGKVRKENHAEISNVLRQILLQVEPADFNVVVFSASGGSGSVIGPLIMAELLERLPVVMYYDHNDRDRRRSDVDAQLHLAISSLAVLSSKQNREMDTRDIANWVQFSKTTSVGPQLAQLEVFADAEQAGKIKDPISVASIYVSEEVKPVGLVPEYHAAGYLSEDSDKFEQLHYVITIDALPNIVDSVKKTLEQYHTQRDSRVKQASILGDDDQTTDSGLVL